MTAYEIIAISIAGLSMLVSVIPLIWKLIKRPILNHIPTGRGYLFINKSGSYVQIEGVFEAKNKALTITDSTVRIVREKDERVLNLSWSSFLSPVNQRIIGAFSSTSETAHPFRIEADSVYCAFTEYSDINNSAYLSLEPLFMALDEEANKYRIITNNMDAIMERYTSSDAYIKAHDALQKQLFWEIGDYVFTLTAKHKKGSKTFNYTFNLDSGGYSLVKHNMEESLLFPLKTAFGVKTDFRNVQIRIENK